MNRRPKAIAAALAVALFTAAYAYPQSTTTRSALQPGTRFEVVSVKRNNNCSAPYAARERGSAAALPPGRLDLHCRTTMDLIQMAYVQFANGQMNPPSSITISGGSAWANSDRYDIKAKAEGTPRQETMHGPMLQRILEDRFQVKVHHETKEVPVYELTEAKGGSKLKPFQEGRCIAIDPSKLRQPEQDQVDGQKTCAFDTNVHGHNIVNEAEGWTVEQFCLMFFARLDRPVINKTGIPGRFNFRLEYTPDSTTPGYRILGDRDSAATSIFEALQEQLGLKFVSSKGRGEFLVIDHVERPSEN